ncbi:hypothetical protein [Methylocystis bryophila]|uniref:Uncharacterized protein n=1 Tax=Methylocystis bryophila TaxID=655015 RepID=A0A1W6MUJ0_9HYPH|nr:hypothetical protein [Methylocystis bryophila]ARN81176.1 hypothetical protein B1812_08865 [Methylocystis bryophila]BDV37111.1 hypothetical protein DSM21852_03640 [Methylocystis bryophila]
MIALALYHPVAKRRDNAFTLVLSAPRAVARPRRRRLFCQWRRDPGTGRLICAWSAEDAQSRKPEQPGRLRLAA